MVLVSEVGVASSVLALVRNIASAFGISVFATVLTNATESSMVAIARYSTINTTNPLLRAQAFVLMGLKAQIDGFRIVFLAAAALMILAAFLAVWTWNVKELNIGATKVEIMVE